MILCDIRKGGAIKDIILIRSSSNMSDLFAILSNRVKYRHHMERVGAGGGVTFGIIGYSDAAGV